MEAVMASPQKPNPILIKRYGRSRLYDTIQCRYVNIEDLRQWIIERKNFVVVDFETGADITRVLLA
jgi:polyhydroxyalkanoate synthesis regulator protein